MTRSDKTALLRELVDRTAGRRFTVPEIRDQWVERAGEFPTDNATLRRWINGRLSTLVRQGTLIKGQFESSKRKYYQLATVPSEHDALCAKPENQPEKTGLELSKSVKALKDELGQCKLSIVSQLAEIEEYKRISEVYPSLRAQASQQFEDTMEANYRLLGRVKALETLIARQELRP